MILQRITSTVTLIAVLTVSVWGVFSAQLASAQTEEVDFNNSTCPIENTIWIDFQNTEEISQTEDIFSETLLVTNSSAYTLGGVRVAVAAYQSESDVFPKYWTVLEGEHILIPNLTAHIPLELDLSAMAAGEYQIKAFVMQGDEAAVLGAVMRDNEETEGVIVVKSDVRSKESSVSVAVNGQSYVGQAITIPETGPVEIVITTKNNDTEPLINSSMVGVLTQGEVPLGSAIWSNRVDSVKLIPGSSRVTKVPSSHVREGEHTVFAGLITKNTLQPIVAVPVQIGESAGVGSWSYLSKIGFSQYPLEADSEIVTCVKNIGENEELEGFSEMVGVKQTISTEGGEVASLEQSNATANAKNYFTFSPGMRLTDFVLTTDFFQQRFNTQAVADNTETDIDESVGSSLSELSVVGTVTQTLVCPDDESCLPPEPAATSKVGDYVAEVIYSFNPFWIYIGGFIILILMIFIIVKRLPPKEEEVLDEEPKEESQ